MSQFVKTRVRCPLYPAKVGERFQTIANGAPIIFKSAGCQFEFALFDGTGLFDVANVASITVSVKAENNPGGLPTMLGTVARPNINTTLTPEQWANGVSQHVVVPFLGTETGLSAGTWDITVSGFTDDNVIDPDVFQISKLTVIDAGIIGLVSPPVVPGSAVTLEQLQGLLAGYVTHVMLPGKTLSMSDQDGTWRRVLGCALDPLGNPVRTDDLEQL